MSLNNNWTDHGLIFDLTKYNESNESNFKWAQGPQIIDQGSYFRLYFSTRIFDLENLPVSKVFFIDLLKDFSAILGKAKEVKIQSGILGGFDQHGIFPFHPYRINSKIIMALSSGWKRMQNVDIDMSMGQAVSIDGEHFARNGYGPIIAAAPDEPFLVGDPFVFCEEESYQLFYIFGTEWTKGLNQPERTYKIGSMNSKDGISFDRNQNGIQIIPDSIPNEAQAMPTVVRINKNLHMFYCYRNSFDFRDGGQNSYRLGHAVSKDSKNWKIDHSVLPDIYPQWSESMQCYPHCIVFEGKVWILYNGNNFGKNGIGLMSKSIGDF